MLSLCEPTVGPNFTFSSGGNFTTVDYCFINCWAAHLVASCEVSSKHPLNLSDHLLIRIELNCKPDLLVLSNQVTPKPNWRKAIKDSSIHAYQSMISSQLSSFLSAPLSNVDEIESKISSVAALLHQAASDTIPTYRSKGRTKNHIHDN